MFPQARKGKGLIILQMEEIGLLAAFDPLPFIKAIRHNIKSPQRFLNFSSISIGKFVCKDTILAVCRKTLQETTDSIRVGHKVTKFYLIFSVPSS